MTGNYFCVRRNNRRKHNQHFKLLYFKLKSHFGKSNKISACKKLNLLLINGNCLVVSSLEMQRKLIQTKLHDKSLSNKRLITTFKCSSCEKLFLRWFDNWKLMFFCKSLSLLWDSFSRHIVAFFEKSVLKEVCTLRYLHYISANTKVSK